MARPAIFKPENRTRRAHGGVEVGLSWTRFSSSFGYITNNWFDKTTWIFDHQIWNCSFSVRNLEATEAIKEKAISWLRLPSEQDSEDWISSLIQWFQRYSRWFISCSVLNGNRSNILNQRCSEAHCHKRRHNNCTSVPLPLALRLAFRIVLGFRSIWNLSCLGVLIRFHFAIAWSSNPFNSVVAWSSNPLIFLVAWSSNPFEFRHGLEFQPIWFL